MNSQLPNSIRNALARESAADSHPSADLLTAFVERTLLGGEKQKVSDHLARCPECRDAVFLSSAAGPDAAEAEAHTLPHGSAALWRKRSWRMMWALPFATVVLLVSGLLLQQSFLQRRAAPAAPVRLAENPPQTRMLEIPPTSSVQPQAAKPASQPERKRPATKARVEVPVSAAPAETQGMPVPAGVVAGAVSTPQPAVLSQLPAKAAAETAPATPAAASPPRSAFANSNADHVMAKSNSSGHLVMAPGAFRGMMAMHPSWRVTPEGHLEHFTQGAWARVLPDSSTDVRCVSVLADNVWAGGSGGAVFHSSDGGQSWNPVVLKTSSGTAETSAVVSIRFDDSEHGELTTETGARYKTIDGGATWTSQ